MPRIRGEEEFAPRFVRRRSLYDAILLCHYDGDLKDENKLIDPSVETGGLIYDTQGPVLAGHYGIAIQCAEACTNLCVNPSFEIDNAGWATGGANTISRTLLTKKIGEYGLKCTFNDSAVLAEYFITLTWVAHCAGIWIYVPDSWDGGTIYWSFVEFTGGTGEANGTANMEKRSQWQFVKTGPFTPNSGDLSGYIRLWAYGNPSQGKYVYIDAVQINAGPYVHIYCDGSLGQGHSWSGSPHASTSSRTKTDLRYQLNAPDEFSVAIWLGSHVIIEESTINNRAWTWYGDENNYAALQYNTASDKWEGIVKINGNMKQAYEKQNDMKRHVPTHLILTWDGSKATLFKDGVLQQEA